MPAYLKKTQAEIMSQALAKLQNDTPITALGPGSIARALVEAVSMQLGDMYDILDYNINQTLVSSASGTSLDMLGKLYQTERKGISELAVIDKRVGSFIFYLQAPYGSDIAIPKGTNIYTDATSYLGKRFSFTTTEENTIPAGRTRIYASIAPSFVDSVYTAGANTLVVHDFVSPINAPVYCTNPKSISPLPTMETDEQYRLRIMKSVRVASSGTLEAVRFAGLNITGIRDIRIRQAPYGMGSFEAIVVPERGIASADSVRRATEAMEATRSLGVRMYAKTPVELPMSISIAIVAPTVNTSQARETITRRAGVSVSRYINSLLPGSELVYNQLLQLVMDSSESVKDVTISEFSVNGKEILRRNYRPAEDEQIVVGTTNITIAQT